MLKILASRNYGIEWITNWNSNNIFNGSFRVKIDGYSEIDDILCPRISYYFSRGFETLSKTDNRFVSLPTVAKILNILSITTLITQSAVIFLTKLFDLSPLSEYRAYIYVTSKKKKKKRHAHLHERGETRLNWSDSSRGSNTTSSSHIRTSIILYKV